MIKFFRKIRQKLLAEGKLRKYLLYAIGEILLVVIGILIALQVNNWNIEKKSERKAEELAKNLLQELRGVKRLMDNQLGIVENQRKLIRYLINTDEIQMDTVLSLSMSSGNLKVDPINFIFSHIMYFNPRGSIYSSAINEGTLVLIESKEIIKDLGTVYTMSEKRSSEHVKRENLINDRIQEHISDKYQDLFNSAKLKNVLGAWDDTTTIKVLEKISTDGKLRYLLSAKLQMLQFKYGSLKYRIYPTLEESIDYFENSLK